MFLMGYVCLWLMGILLGLVGAGGAILTIPILVYLLGIPVLVATTYSLVIVGATSFFGALHYRNDILFGKAIFFAVPSVLGIFVARTFVIPQLPPVLFYFSLHEILILLLVIFMLLGGFSLIHSFPQQKNLEKRIALFSDKFKVVFLGLFLGFVIGLLGTGGGFFIIPVFMFFMQASLPQAVATSLFIITLNSLVGFLSDKHDFSFFDVVSLSKYLGCAFLGMLLGIFLSKFLRKEGLKKFLGYFVWTVAFAILLKEFLF
jgi:uncharacterized membrane protein YfcA